MAQISVETSLVGLTPSIVRDIGLEIPANNTIRLELTEDPDWIYALQGSVDIRTLLTDDAFGPGQSSLIIRDVDGIKVPQSVVIFYLAGILDRTVIRRDLDKDDSIGLKETHLERGYRMGAETEVLVEDNAELFIL